MNIFEGHVYLQEALNKFRKTLTIIDIGVINWGVITADEFLQKPDNVETRLATSHTHQFAYHIIFIKTKRNRKKRAINKYESEAFISICICPIWINSYAS
ncbi:hypothetical protein V1477_021199 [Vespula maculifrons]|uniref:Uncharacterized protein n=1 Tax=Vespula maculifrons TaxID=7453 RepID=A0ABD2AJ71_VESMC